MHHYVYMIKSIKQGKVTTYVGHTKDLKNRLKLHNAGKGAKFTRGRYWKIIYSEKYATKNEAKSREYYIKKNRKFRNLIKERYK